MFDWLSQHETAFTQIKQLITKARILHYYDIGKEVSLEWDSSEVGLKAVLTQKGHPIAYASRAVTKSEQNYAQIKRECLAIVFTAKHFEQYILGYEKVKVFSDHKPLETLLAKPIHMSPKRLQWMRLWFKKYSLDVKYKPGPQMYISDTLSCASLPTAQATTEDNCTIFQLQELELIRDLANINMEDTLFVTNHHLSQM